MVEKDLIELIATASTNNTTCKFLLNSSMIGTPKLNTHDLNEFYGKNSGEFVGKFFEYTLKLEALRDTLSQLRK